MSEWKGYAKERGFECDGNGRIVSPGKFEGEMIYVPYFWDVSLDGGVDYDERRGCSVPVESHERSLFRPFLERRLRVKLIEDDAGFVREL